MAKKYGEVGVAMYDTKNMREKVHKQNDPDLRPRRSWSTPIITSLSVSSTSGGNGNHGECTPKNGRNGSPVCPS